MIKYRYLREKELMLEYADHLHDPETAAILNKGAVETAGQARHLAKFYWRMVDASLDDDIESWLERINTTLYIALDDAGFGTIWDEEIPVS